jgi:hypothetical protein
MWNHKPILNSIIDILVQNKGEVLDKRIEELVKKEFPFINSLILDELFLKMESLGIINVFKVAKNKKMIVLKKHSDTINAKLLEDSH